MNLAQKAKTTFFLSIHSIWNNGRSTTSLHRCLILLDFAPQSPSKHVRFNILFSWEIEMFYSKRVSSNAQNLKWKMMQYSRYWKNESIKKILKGIFLIFVSGKGCLAKNTHKLYIVLSSFTNILHASDSLLSIFYVIRNQFNIVM